MSLIHQIDNFSSRIINWTPSITLPSKFDRLLGAFLTKFLLFSGLASWRSDFTDSDLNLRASCFISEARKKGWQLEVLRGPFGFTIYSRAKKNGKRVAFEGLPLTDLSDKYKAGFIDNKGKIKIILKKNDFPVAPGKLFWFWQIRAAVNYGRELDYPLVVKPSRGSGSEGVTTNIGNSSRLKKAVNVALRYGPTFIVEKYITEAFVHRATVVNFKFVACVKQVPANVVGDGVSTIRELIERKNRDKRRGEWGQRRFVLYKIVQNKTTIKLLADQNYNLDSVLSASKIIDLQRDPFLKLGGDLIEVTPRIHPDNLQLFRTVATFFAVRLVGIDFICPDISVSWRNQRCAILELNSLPFIELHHFPSTGASQNVARALVEALAKYY
ncbi:hypothetical protein KJ903_05430 [Patescibacteria group bacterium]|nr:hypothetical protein [Patescibacteria group bacterium]